MDKKQLLQEGYREARYISAKEHKTILFTDYMINKEGQIWSFRTSNPKILDGAFRNGYKIYSLCTTENGKNKKITVYGHVLIASTFFEETNINNIDDDNTFEQVHHVNHNINDNRPENLLWISKVEHKQLHSKSDITRKRRSENHADMSGDKSPMYGRTGANCPNSIPIVAFTDSGSYHKEFAGMHDAERELGVSSSHICRCVKGERKSAGKITINGVIEKIKWRYK